MAKGAAHVSDGDAAFDNTSRIEPKRSHNWFVDAEPQLFPNKKQARQAENNKSNSGISNSNVLPWENVSSFQSVPSQFMDRLFGSESERSVNFSDRNISPIEADDMRRKGIEDHFGEDASVGLSISPSIEDPESCFNNCETRKVKVNQVKDSDNCMHDPKEHSFSRENNSDMSTIELYNPENESSFISMGHGYDRQCDSVAAVSHTYNGDDLRITTATPDYDKDNGIPLSMANIYVKEGANILSFGGFHEEHEIIPVSRTLGRFDTSHCRSSNPTLEDTSRNQLGISISGSVASAAQTAKLRPESVSRTKPEFKPSKKEAPNSFPSNVRSLLSTGMLDGVSVKYVSLSREELRGVIKGSGYLCGCQSCNLSKVLNAYEFERHAGCKTKHPNNHIYFDNGKTIYQIVQELRSTPESLLFDTIQTVFGAPINQKSFRIWKGKLDLV
ncbi:ras-related protein RABE1c-like isoform X1 [Hibiscus syriacus]|uniref:Ras-related protein RABE1c-like isoform X1 n=1 Tax=Hibiscus syriacus TaxID=106335 RepID=A0A6A3ACF8_HIBSY|nr:ras-related protein RABE1c-like isoform X1 [Hibiscus syriacus]